tara:strand:- start:3407 stop:3646 length:240 start_codon:yes stop_codon:yes gene_type:complete
MINIENFKIEIIETTTGKWNEKKKKHIDFKVPLIETKTVYEQENIYDSFELYKHLDYWKERANQYDIKVKVTFNVSNEE